MKDGYKSGKVKLRIFFLVLGVGTILLLMYQGGRWLETWNSEPEPRGNYLQRYYYGDIVEVSGVTYRRKSNLTTILLMGIDCDHDTLASNNRSGGQADFLRLVVLNSETKEVSQIQIDRDTMVPITVLGVLGNNAGLSTTQICLSHSFGDGGSQSCELTVEAVSKLLLGTQIDHYVAMNLDGISVLNDWVGGVTVTLKDDFSSADSSMVSGVTMTLTGEQAEIYVRNRMYIGTGTNEARMERQQNYILQLSKQIDKQFGENKEQAGKLYDALSPYLTTDMTRGNLINILWEAYQYRRIPVVNLEGKYEIGTDGFMEYYADEDALTELVLELLYTRE